MKKTLLIILLSMLLFGCKSKSKNTSRSSKKTSESIISDYSGKRIKWSFEDTIEGAQFIYFGKLKSKKIGSNILDNNDSMSPATRAKYNIYTFNVTETLYESYAINKDEINLYSEENLLFSEENEYLLPLSLINYAYFTTDVFTMRGGLTLSLNDPLNNTINLDEKIVTKNNMNLSQSFNKDDLINYINTLPKSSLEYYCKEINHSKIIENSDYIFKIKIGDLSFTRNSNYAKSEAYNVEILEEIKGKNNHSNEIIKIEFPMGQVEKDDIIYVGLFIGGHLVIDSGFFYLLSSSELLLESDFK